MNSNLHTCIPDPNYGVTGTAGASTTGVAMNTQSTSTTGQGSLSLYRQIDQAISAEVVKISAYPLMIQIKILTRLIGSIDMIVKTTPMSLPKRELYGYVRHQLATQLTYKAGLVATTPSIIAPQSIPCNNNNNR